MANVVTYPHLQVDFHPGPVHHSPSPLGFGFGLSAAPSMPSWSSHVPQSPWNNTHALQPSPLRATKRRHEPDDEAENGIKHVRDDVMDRSPTPERPRRAAPKRARATPATVANVKTGQTSKENKPPSSDDDNDVDVGVLLASLPPQSLLPLLTSLLSAHPSLKPVVLSLIPRPTLDTALQALATSAQKLRDAYPYSSPPFSQAGLASTFGGFGGGFGSNKSNTSASTTGFGFGRLTAGPSFGHPHSNNTGMRDEYIISRLRPHISDFVSACFSYLPYFSNVSAPLTSPSFSKPSNSMDIQSHSSALRQQHKDKLHPTETFLFLSALTTHILSQPPLTLFSLAPQLLPRLSEEWKAWVDHIDEVVNRQGGMFGKETVNSWERALDEFAEAKGNGMEVMKEIRDRWVSKVGWLVGRQPMEEL